MEIATFSAIATTTGVIRMIGALNGMIFATTTKAFGAGSATIGKRQMIGEPAFVPVKTSEPAFVLAKMRQELFHETATETM